MTMRALLIIITFLGWSTANAQYTRLLDFNGSNGKQPRGSLVSDGTFLYGTTTAGGASDSGTIFKIKPDGTGSAVLFNFSGSDGRLPFDGMFLNNGFLYGTALYGGAGHLGVVFRIKTDGSGDTILFNFSGANGSRPISKLIFDGQFLYGTTEMGGANDKGTVFKIKPDGTGFTKLLDFTGANGKYPEAGLFYDGNFLYGTTEAGGSSNMGTVFRVKPNGTMDSVLFSFAGANGYQPFGTLVSDGTFLYGTTFQGGVNNAGIVFKIKPDGAGFSKLFDFGGTDGRNPMCSLMFSGGDLFGTTIYGASADKGTLFKIRTDGSGFITLSEFTGSNGSYPNSSLIADATYLYGLTFSGGIIDSGTVYRFNYTCTPVTNSLDTTLCAGENLTIGAHTYSVTGVYSDTLQSAEGCDSIIVSRIIVLTGSSATWQSLNICSGQSVQVGADVYTSSGTYTYTFHGSSCDSVITTNLTVTPTPTVTINGYDSVFCSVGTVTLTASGGSTYLWSDGSSGASIVVSAATAALYSVVATNGTCTDTASAYVTPYLHAGFSSTYATCCASNWLFTDTSQAPAGDPVVAWSWTFSGGYPSASSLQDPTVTLPGGTHTVCLSVTTQHGCIDSTCTTIFSLNVNQAGEASQLFIYPDPATEFIWIKSDPAIKEFEITDLLGQVLFYVTRKHEIEMIDLRTLQPGIYLVKTSAGVQKFIKQ